MVGKTKEITIDSKLLETISRIANDNNTTEDKIINDFVLKGIEENETEEEKIKRLKINNELKKIVPEDYEEKTLDDLLGKFDIGPTNAVKLKKELHE